MMMMMVMKYAYRQTYKTNSQRLLTGQED